MNLRILIQKQCCDLGANLAADRGTLESKIGALTSQLQAKDDTVANLNDTIRIKVRVVLSHV